MTTESYIHGFTVLAWDDAALPTSFWAGIEKYLTDRPSRLHPVMCWLWRRNRIGRQKVTAQEFVITRLLGVKWADVLAWVPTCGQLDCVNPAHLCVTLREQGAVIWQP